MPKFKIRKNSKGTPSAYSLLIGKRKVEALGLQDKELEFAFDHEGKKLIVQEKRVLKKQSRHEQR